MKLNFHFRFPSVRFPLPLAPKTSLGVDIGTSSLKIVELRKWGNRRTLQNYGEIEAGALYDRPFRTLEKNMFTLSPEDIARAIRAIMIEAGMTTRQAVFSIPDFSSFFTTFQLPPLSREELASSVAYEARRHIPVPVSEVVFDWQVVEGNVGRNQPLKILLIAVPKEVINQYQDIAKKSGLFMNALEAEVFGLIRSGAALEQGPIILLDIGAQTTTVNSVEAGTVRLSRSLDIAGNSFTERIAQSFSLERSAAREMKEREGLLPGTQSAEILSPLLDVIVGEIQRVAEDFLQLSGKRVQKVILGGGSALLPNLSSYVQAATQIPTETIDPFRSLVYPPILEETTKHLGPSYAVAIGMALRGLE
ncbi:MAG: type IV pilus assembly protein PilM [bacterium]|nr:type IV pilus assembly protein PilM [bacterium]